jgi:carboxymethylenebutenolidase
VSLTSEDGHQLHAYRAAPLETPQGGLVVVQEAFGFNEHIRTIYDNYAQNGFRASSSNGPSGSISVLP